MKFIIEDIKQNCEKFLDQTLSVRETSQWMTIYDRYIDLSDTSHFVFHEVKEPAQIVPEGAPPRRSHSKEEKIKNLFFKKNIGSSFLFELSDLSLCREVYLSRLKNNISYLVQQIELAKEIVGASILNNGFNPSHVGGDVQPLFSSEHLDVRSGSTYQNTFRGDMMGHIDKTMVVESLDIIQKNGLRASQLIIPDSFLSDVMREDLERYFSNGVITNSYLSNDFFFIKTDYSPSFWYFVGEPVLSVNRYKQEAEDMRREGANGENLQIGITQETMFGVTNPRSVFGVRFVRDEKDYKR